MVKFNSNSPLSPKEEAVGLAGCDAYEKGDFLGAIDLFKKAARIGRTNSWYVNIGNIYADHLVPPQPDKAVHYYRLGVRTDAMAAYALAVHYYWKDEARWQRYWLDRAVEMGQEDARERFSDHKKRFKRKLAALRIARQNERDAATVSPVKRPPR